MLKSFLYSFTIAKDGLLTFLIPNDASADLIKKVLPAPSSPLSIIRSPFLQDLIKFIATIAESASLWEFIFDRYSITITLVPLLLLAISFPQVKFHRAEKCLYSNSNIYDNLSDRQNKNLLLQ